MKTQMYLIAALVVLLTSAWLVSPAAPQQATPPTAGDMSPMEPPGVCIYKVTVQSGIVTIYYNPSPCPEVVIGWYKRDVKLPSGICGLEVGGLPRNPEVQVSTLPCSTPGSTPSPTPAPRGSLPPAPIGALSL